MRVCPKCKEYTEHFNTKYRCSYCISCDKKYRKEQYQQNKQKYKTTFKKNKPDIKKRLKNWIIDIKTNLTCFDCKLPYQHYQIEFDHIDPNLKIAGIAYMINQRYTKSKIIEEINKCEPVCVNCHRMRTFNRYNRHHNKLRSNETFIRELKTNPCVDCHKIYHWCVMDFDHLINNKQYNISQLKSYSTSSIIKEVIKCELVCANCHRQRTYDRLKS